MKAWRFRLHRTSVSFFEVPWPLHSRFAKKAACSWDACFGVHKTVFSRDPIEKKDLLKVDEKKWREDLQR